MTYATLFMPDGNLAVVLQTKREGGPFACVYARTGISRPTSMRRLNENAMHILWRHVRDRAPRVYQDAIALGWTRPS